MSSARSSWQGEPKTACFIFPEASGHINASLALTSHLTKQSNWTVHYLSAAVMKEAILDAGASFTDERTAAPELCEGGLGYFAAYERLRKEKMEEGSKAWEGRAHIENLFALKKMDGTLDWLRRKRPSVVVYCPIWNRVGQLASLVLGIPHVAIVTIAGFGGFHLILKNFLDGEGATVEDFEALYKSSEINQAAIESLCSPPYSLDRKLFESGAPVYYIDCNPPYGWTLGPAENLVTTIPSLRDPLFDTIEEEDELYKSKCGVKLTYIGPMLGRPGQIRASTHKAAFTVEEQRLLIEQSEQTHRRRSNLHPKDEEDIVAIVKAAKERKRRVILVSLGTVVTSDRAGFGWHGTALGESITGKELVQSVINGVLDAFGLCRESPLQSIKVDMTQFPLIICAVGQQPDALDSIDLPPNAIARASLPQVDILRQMDSYDLFVQHGGQNSTMEGLSVGVPMAIFPTFGDQPVNAKKLVGLGVAVSVDRPTEGGSEAVAKYRKSVADAVCVVQAEEDKYAAAAASMKDQIAASGGEVEGEAVLIRAIEKGI